MRRWLPLIAATALACSCSPRASTVDTTSTTLSAARLPPGVKPLRYHLDLKLVPEADGVEGRVGIDLALAAPSREIVFHSLGLTLSDVKVTPRGGAPMDARVAPGPSPDMVKLELPAELAAGEARVDLAYRGPWTPGLRGCYKVEDGDESYIFTQFETTAARACFPSFDEPGFKTPFEISLTAPEGQVAITNTRETRVEPAGPGLVRRSFAPTQPLPTYLVAFVVGPMDVVEAPDIPPTAVRKDPIPLRGLAARGKGKDLGWALSVTPRLLLTQEEYFGIAYPFDKLDLIAVPDFEAGAMENAGAITFRETKLLLPEEASADEARKRGIGDVTAHELAHQWFGNLTTMVWWDDLWLNEGFATWMAYKTDAIAFPEWRMELEQQHDLYEALGADSLPAARQIAQPIVSGDDIYNAFDGITYDKGAAVLGMFERYLGEDAFRRGVQLYLRRHTWGNATSADLLVALEEASGRAVKAPFETFLYQPGVPLVEVQIGACDTGAPPRLSLTQSRYFPLGVGGDRDKTWGLPVCVTYETGGRVEQACELMDQAQGSLELAGCPSWVMPNAGQRGYYYWSLPPGDLGRLRDAGLPRLAAVEKAGVLSSVAASFYGGRLPAGEVLQLAGSLASDADPRVAILPLVLLEDLNDRLVREEDRAAWESWLASLYRPWQEKLGLAPAPGEGGDATMARADLVHFLALIAREPTLRTRLAEMGRALIGYGGDGAIHFEVVDVNLASTALQVAVQVGDQAFFDAVVDQLKTQTDAGVRVMLLEALSASHDPELAQRARELARTGALRSNERGEVILAQVQDPALRSDAWASFKKTFDLTMRFIPEAYLGYTPFIGMHFCTEADAADVEGFFTPRLDKLPGAPRNLASVLEIVRACAALRAQEADDIGRFLPR